MAPVFDEIDTLCINTIRTLSMDAVERANSGHPGTPMALAPVAYSLWQNHLNYDPQRPLWPNRDRFVLSAGHASMLLYSVLHLAGVRDAEGNPAVPLEDIVNFRQWGSKCPGHPEFRHTAGVETTTGPLGQGVATATGMAIAGKWLAARYNTPDKLLFDYRVYALCSDGDMMEGVASEAASLAGHLGLDNLCWIYDNNQITIEGRTSLAFSEDVARRFSAYGWHVISAGDANDLPALDAAFTGFKRTVGRPTLIIVDSQIAYGAPKKQGTSAAHGAPLGTAEVRGAKQFYGWDPDAQFHVPAGVRERFTAGLGARGRAASAAWNLILASYQQAQPALAHELDLLWRGALPADWDALPVFPADSKGMATRKASGLSINAVAPRIPWLVGGSADLAPSNNTAISGAGGGSFQADTPAGRNFHFGIREHAMGCILNGMALCGLRPYGATFLVFSDYARPAIRLAALMGLPVIYVFTHDSISLGEDGPTHQPVEHLAALRAIPNLLLLRPCDANETAAAWRVALRQRTRPTVLVLSRQDLPVLDREALAPAAVEHGAYVLSSAEEPQVLLIGTGSEVPLCLEAQALLAADGIPAQVVSMPSWELFGEQDEAYQQSVLPPALTARVAVEKGLRFGWERFVGPCGAVVSIDRFGASAPQQVLDREFGFTADNVVRAARTALANASAPRRV